MRENGVALAGTLAKAVGFVLAASFAIAQTQPRLPQREFRISSNVDRVVLPVTVLDRKRRIVVDLPQSSFRIYDDGQPQNIIGFLRGDIPLTIGLVMDSSTSMGHKRDSAILAAIQLMRLSNPQDEAFVVNFNEKVAFGLPDDQPFSADPTQLEEALQGLPCHGRTALYDALISAAGHLKLGKLDRRALILVSDGGDNSSEHHLEQAIKAVRRSNAMVYAIGLFDNEDPDRDPGVLKQLARQTGGEAFFPQSPKELPAIMAHIAAVLRRQYTITFAPSDKSHDGRFHHVSVVAVTPDSGHRLEVRTRSGYYAPSPEYSAAGASE